MFDADNPNDLCKNTCFYKYGHISGPRGSPDMILTAFDVKFHETKDELPPKVCRPLRPLRKKHMFYKIGHNSSPRGSPDMILTAFDVKFCERKDEIPPRASNPSYTFRYPILGI